MKRILLGALVAFASLTAVRSAQAGRTFGLFVCCGKCGRGCSCDFRIRQYNAFTPVCCGTITAMPGMGYGDGMGYFGLGGGGYCPGGVGAPTGVEGGNPTGTPQKLPAPQPGNAAPLPPGQTFGQYYAPVYNVQPVGFYPNYGYGPMNYWDPMGQVPYYWNPMGGR